MTLAYSRHLNRNRAAELLAWLQLGTCPRCGRARYATRRQARSAARIGAPGTRLRAYRCGDGWHLTTPSWRPQLITPPVTAVRSIRPGGSRTVVRLDTAHRGERGCRTSLGRTGMPDGDPPDSGDRKRANTDLSATTW